MRYGTSSNSRYGSAAATTTARVRAVSVAANGPQATLSSFTDCQPRLVAPSATPTTSKLVTNRTTVSEAGSAYRRAAGTQPTLPALSRTNRTCAVSMKGSASTQSAATLTSTGTTSAA